MTASLCGGAGLILVKEALYDMGVPVAYMQLDDWWYQGPFFFGNVKSVVVRSEAHPNVTVVSVFHLSLVSFLTGFQVRV